jgi:hypothetical protein
MKINVILTYVLISACIITTGCVKKSTYELTLSELSQAKIEGQKTASELAQAKTEGQKTASELVEAKRTIQSLTDQLNEANRKLAIKPKLPVIASVRKANYGEGYVLTVDTTVKRNLKVVLTHNVKELQTKTQYNLTLNSQVSNEFGWQQGTTFNIGDTAELSHPDFETLKVSIP